MNLFERFEVLKGPRDIKEKKYKLIEYINYEVNIIYIIWSWIENNFGRINIKILYIILLLFELTSSLMLLLLLYISF